MDYSILNDIKSGWRLFTSKGTTYLIRGKEVKTVPVHVVANLIENCDIDPIGTGLKLQWVPSRESLSPDQTHSSSTCSGEAFRGAL